MTYDEAITFFKTFILPSIRKLAEDVGIKISTLTSCKKEHLSSVYSIFEIGFSPMFNCDYRNVILLKQRLQGKLWNLFSEYGIIVNEITFECRCFPDLIISIRAEELIECFRRIGKRQEDFNNETVRQRRCRGSLLL